MIILVNMVGIMLIGLIVWWFWFSQSSSGRLSSDKITNIVVDNGVYSPSRIEVESGKKLVLSFLRKDPNPCAEKVVFTQLGVTRDLPLNEEVSVSLNIDRAGTYDFTCQMGMYRGQLIIPSSD